MSDGQVEWDTFQPTDLALPN